MLLLKLQSWKRAFKPCVLFLKRLSLDGLEVCKVKLFKLNAYQQKKKAFQIKPFGDVVVDFISMLKIYLVLRKPKALKLKFLLKVGLLKVLL